MVVGENISHDSVVIPWCFSPFLRPGPTRGTGSVDRFRGPVPWHDSVDHRGTVPWHDSVDHRGTVPSAVPYGRLWTDSVDQFRGSIPWTSGANSGCDSGWRVSGPRNSRHAHIYACTKGFLLVL